MLGSNVLICILATEDRKNNKEQRASQPLVQETTRLLHMDILFRSTHGAFNGGKGETRLMHNIQVGVDGVVAAKPAKQARNSCVAWVQIKFPRWPTPKPGAWGIGGCRCFECRCCSGMVLHFAVLALPVTSAGKS